ncbi:MAG: hypothetical protein ACMXYD_05505 [Candidatus Woesearchaeota archaeon]
MGLEDIACFPRFDTEAEQAIANRLWAQGDIPWLLREEVQSFPKDLAKLPCLLRNQPAIYIFDADARESYGVSEREGVFVYIQQVCALEETPFLGNVQDMVTSSQVHVPLRLLKGSALRYFVLEEGRFRFDRSSIVTGERDYFVKLPYLFSAYQFVQ